MDYELVRTDEPLDEVLLRFLARRQGGAGDLRPPVDAAGRAGGADPAAGPPLRPAAAAAPPVRGHLLRAAQPEAHRLAGSSSSGCSSTRCARSSCCAIPVALARPELRREARRPRRVAKGPAATAVVLDASLSMRWRGRAPRLFERGRDEARDALKDLLPEEPATVLAVHGRRPPRRAPLGFDRARLRALIDEAKPTYGAADLSRCLELAARALEESPLPGKRLVRRLRLHGQRAPARGAAAHGEGPDGQAVRPEVVLRDVARGQDALPNHALVDLKVEPALQAGPARLPVHLHGANFSPEAVKDLEAALSEGDDHAGQGLRRRARRRHRAEDAHRALRRRAARSRAR